MEGREGVWGNEAVSIIDKEPSQLLPIFTDEVDRPDDPPGRPKIPHIFKNFIF